MATSDGEGTLQRQWTFEQVKLCEKAQLFGYEGVELFSAWNEITMQNLLGIVDGVRSRAMEFALDLQAEFPKAGEQGGPTVVDPALAQTIYNITNNITEHGTNIATGPGTQQVSKATVGDVTALRGKLEELGLGDAERDEFLAAITEENGTDGSKATNFLQRVESHGIKLATSVSSAFTVQTLVALAKSCLGIHC